MNEHDENAKFAQINRELPSHVSLVRSGRGYLLKSKHGNERTRIIKESFEEWAVSEIVALAVRTHSARSVEKRPLTHFLFIRDEKGTRYEIVRELPRTLEDDPTCFTWTDENDNVLGYTYAADANPDRRVVELLDKFVVTVPSLNLCAEGATLMEANDNLYIGVPHDSAQFAKIATSTKNFYTVADVVTASYALVGNRLGKTDSELGEKSIRFLMRMGTNLPKRTAPKTYSTETKEIGTGWNDSGFRFRLVCSDGRKTGWADYTRVCFLDDVGAMTPYYHGGSDVVILPLREVLAHIAIGEATEAPETGESAESVESGESATMPAKED